MTPTLAADTMELRSTMEAMMDDDTKRIAGIGMAGLMLTTELMRFLNTKSILTRAEALELSDSALLLAELHSAGLDPIYAQATRDGLELFVQLFSGKPATPPPSA